MRRREFIAGLGSAAAWPVTARAQQGDRIRRIGVLLPAVADDATFQPRVEAFLKGLALFGWTIGGNVRIDTRWATANATDIRRQAAELAALTPDVILANGGSTAGPKDWVLRNPITGIAACCARATTGQAAAPPSPAMNSLRLIQLPRLHAAKSIAAP
jgi:putative ABC transport system substrate-binding protein